MLLSLLKMKSVLPIQLIGIITFALRKANGSRASTIIKDLRYQIPGTNLTSSECFIPNFVEIRRSAVIKLECSSVQLEIK